MESKTGKALVVGAGIGGIRTALDLAETGYRVTLIDRRPGIGGILAQLEHQFPSNGCGMCRMLPLVARDQSAQFCLRKGLFHEGIEILTGTEVAEVSGDPGRFTVTLKEQPRLVDPQRCVGCGLCAEACPIEVADPFNAGMTRRKAIYLPVPHAVPNTYTIDTGACNRCGSCEPVCPVDAIRLDREGPSGFRILVVDDEVILRESLKAWLEETGYAVRTAASGSEALTLMDNEPFHLMFTDIKMPGLSGVELLELALAKQPELAVVMMTAYATVDTAVDTMKFGALDYLTKPFEPQDILQMTARVYGDHQAEQARQIEVGTIVMNCGSAYFDPRQSRNVFQYGENPHVLTSLDFERLVSGLGPYAGRLRRPTDGREVRRIAWIQCIGSRNLGSGAAGDENADFCSSVCCMMALKEAVLAQTCAQGPLEATIFYMDMRAFGKGFERYRQKVAKTPGIKLVRGRVHSLETDPSGDPSLRWVALDGGVYQDPFDLVILPVGQRPAPGTSDLAEQLDLALNPWGFPQGEPFDPTLTTRPGISIGGSWGGLKEIADTVINASAAAAHAAQTLYSHGGSLAPAPNRPELRDALDTETARILVVLCRCKEAGGEPTTQESELARAIQALPGVVGVHWIERLCTVDGWAQVPGVVAGLSANRALLGVCNPYLFISPLKTLALECGLPARLCEAVALKGLTNAGGSSLDEAKALQAVRGGVARLYHADPGLGADEGLPVERRALVVGGGVAGLTASLTIADMGYAVTLVEKSAALGGNLAWLTNTIGGEQTAPLKEKLVREVENHPAIDLLMGASVAKARGKVGDFTTTLQTAEGEEILRHGIVVLATGGGEAQPTGYGYGEHPGVMTQKEMAQALDQDEALARGLTAVAFIQCVGSRDEERPYCSRVCCPTTLKQALSLKRANPETAVFVFYRDMMSPGFSEHYYTEARRAGVVFVPYELKAPPTVHAEGGKEGALSLRAFDPILGAPIEVTADRVVLATGITPQLPAELAAAYGASCDADGFFAEADSKWRPVESLADGVFACGLALGPRDIAGSVLTAKAAAQRSLRILTRDRLPAANLTATVRRALCTLCESCIPACPFGARQLSVSGEAIEIHPALCQGCGACATACPNGAAMLRGLSRRQMLAVVDAVIEQ
jgi:heterodisulfide reductase subunit A